MVHQTDKAYFVIYVRDVHNKVNIVFEVVAQDSAKKVLSNIVSGKKQ